MAKIVAVGDIHVKISSLTTFRAFQRSFLDFLSKNKADAVVILGDISNDFDRIYTQCLNAIDEFFRELDGVGIPTVYVVGNHDMINNRASLTRDHVLSVFENKYNNLTIAYKVTAFSVAGYKFIACPYMPPGCLKDAIGDMDMSEVKAVFCHQEFVGADYGHFVSKDGDSWDDSLPIAISGHIHKHGRVGNVLYVGAPFDHSFGEAGEKTISVLSFGENGVTEERVDLGLPRKITMVLKCSAFNSTAIEPTHDTRIIVVGTSEEIARIKNSSKYKTLPKNTKVIFRVTDKTEVSKAGLVRSYREILRDAVANETAQVQAAYREIYDNPTGKVPTA